MQTLERRVQILFDPVQYEQLAALAKRETRSVGSVVREAVSDRLERDRDRRMDAFRAFIASADEAPQGPMTVEQWQAQKDAPWETLPWADK
ncbi:MAG: hypothetical protein LBG11_01285 [Bifidobacteriaceae bacterium]|nr:hypothetical protein [Bifidobacteriaceae bacterium]